ncbi:hypothetical protein RHCRD62_10079 [Rhodococcus sp. RD6.2]|nr:hypothetical protein RHCRD62_10079 [Rhodococcus sp. RD6.2]
MSSARQLPARSLAYMKTQIHSFMQVTVFSGVTHEKMDLSQVSRRSTPRRLVKAQKVLALHG